MRRRIPPAILAVVLLLATSRDAAGQWVYAASDDFEGQPPVLEILTDAGMLRLLIDKSEQIAIQGVH